MLAGPGCFDSGIESQYIGLKAISSMTLMILEMSLDDWLIETIEFCICAIWTVALGGMILDGVGQFSALLASTALFLV